MKRMSKIKDKYHAYQIFNTAIFLSILLAGGFYNLLNGQGMAVKEYIYLNGKVIAVESYNQNSGDPIPTPVLSWAKVYQGNSVEVRFCTDNYLATNYEIERIPGGVIEIAGGEGCITWYDYSVSQGTSYAYRVRAKNSMGAVGDYSNRDIATVMTFTDDPISAGSTIIKAQHYNELRQAIASVRTCAGLGSPTWTDPNLTQLTIKVVHLTEIRNQLNEALNTLNISIPSYTDGNIVAGSTIVKAAHVQEIREKVK